MATSSKYVIQDLKGQIIRDGKLIFDGFKVDHDKLGEPCSILYSAVTEPHLLVDKPHMHDFPHFLCLFGSNPMDLMDFDAEVEMYLDGEKKYYLRPFNNPCADRAAPLSTKLQENWQSYYVSGNNAYREL